MLKTSFDYNFYVKDGECKYPFATEDFSNDKMCMVYSTNTNDLNFVEQLLQTDHHLFEIIRTDSCKLYMDFDHTNFNEEQLKAHIIYIIDQVNTLLNCHATLQDVVVLSNDGTNIQSFHLIFNTIQMTKKDQKCLIHYLNETTDIDADDRVYSMNRLFRCINQSKTLKKQIFVQRFNQWTILDTLVGINVNGSIYKFNKVYQVDKKITKYATFQELIELLLKDQYEDVFKKNRGGCWCKITTIIKQFYPQLLDKWLMESSNDVYSYDDNLNFNSITKNEWYDENYLYIVFNKKLNQPIHYTSTLTSTEKKRRYLSQWFSDENINEILDGENDVVSQNGINYYFERQNGFIRDDDSFRKNYIYDTIEPTEYPNIVFLENIEECKQRLNQYFYDNDKLFILKSAWGTGKTHHILKEAIKQNVYNKILVITSINSLNMTNVSEFNKTIYEFDGTPFVSHLDAQINKEINLKNCKKVICSIQSLFKVDGNAYDLILIDEMESVFNSYFGQATFKHSSCHSLFNVLSRVLSASNKIIALDADISEPKIQLLKEISYGDGQVYKNKTLSFQNTQFVLHSDDKIDFLYHLLDEQLNNVKMVIPCATRKDARKILYILTNLMNENDRLAPKYKKLVDEYYEKIKHRTILYIDRDGCKLYNYDGGKCHYEMKMNNELVYKSLDSFIQMYKVDTLVFTPTITTGISINDPHFQKCYSVSNNNSIVCNEYLQMLMRTRLLDETHIWVNGKLMNQKNIQLSVEQIKKNRDILDSVFKEIKTMNDVIDDIVINETAYCKLQLINMANHYNSKNNFLFNLIKLLKYHKINYKWNNHESITKIGIDLSENSKEMMERDYEDWGQIPFLNFDEYCINKMSYLFKSNPTPKIDIKYKKYTKQNEAISPQSLFKTNAVYGLIKLEKISIVNECMELFAPTADNILKLDELLYKPIHGIINEQYYLNNHKIESTFTTTNDIYHEYCHRRIQDVMKYYNLKELWFKYIQNNKYRHVRDIRKMVDNLNQCNLHSMTMTPNDKTNVNIEISRLTMIELGINFKNIMKIHLTNKELMDKTKELEKQIKSLPNLFQNKELTKKPKTDKKQAMYQLKKSIEFFDYTSEYVDKNTNRMTAKMVIQPKSYTSKNSFIDYPKDSVIFKSEYFLTLDSRFMYLHNEENSKNISMYDMYKKINPVDASTLIKLMKKTNPNKYDKMEICITLLMNGAKELTREQVLKSYYYNELFYRTFDSDQEVQHSFYISKHKNTMPLEFGVNYVMNYDTKVKSKVIKPYKYKVPLMKHIKKWTADGWIVDFNVEWNCRYNRYLTFHNECMATICDKIQNHKSKIQLIEL